MFTAGQNLLSSPGIAKRPNMISSAKSIAKGIAPKWVVRLMKGYSSRPGMRRRGSPRALHPLGAHFFSRGTPVDRYYIERFLHRQAGCIRGHVLEIADRNYTTQFGGPRVEQSDVLHVVSGNSNATIVGNLETGEGVPEGVYDCIILTQTLLCIYDVQSAILNTHKALRNGGTVLVTVPGISQICRPDFDLWGDYWRFTTLSARRLFENVFGEGNVDVESHGNVLVTAGFLNNLAVDEFSRKELDFNDSNYQLLITVLARKKEA